MAPTAGQLRAISCGITAQAFKALATASGSASTAYIRSARRRALHPKRADSRSSLLSHRPDWAAAMQEVGAMRCSRAPFTASRSAYSTGQRLAQPRRLQGQGRRPSLRCNAVAEVESDVEKRGEHRWGQAKSAEVLPPPVGQHW